MLAFSKVSNLKKISLQPKIKNTNWTHNETPDLPLKFVLTENCNLIYHQQSENLFFKNLGQKKDNSAALPQLNEHKKPIDCISVEDNCLISCSQDAIYLWKWNSSEESWENLKIGEELGKISNCSLSIKDTTALIFLCKDKEILIIKCINSVSFMEDLQLKLKEIAQIPSIENVKEHWTKCFYYLNETPILLAISTYLGTGVYLKTWKINENSSPKLINHKTSSFLKNLTSIDFVKNEKRDIFYALVVDSDGNLEIYKLNETEILLITRFKSEFGQNKDEKSHFLSQSSSSSGIQVEDRIICGRFFLPFNFQNFIQKDEENFPTTTEEIQFENEGESIVTIQNCSKPSNRRRWTKDETANTRIAKINSKLNISFQQLKLNKNSNNANIFGESKLIIAMASTKRIFFINAHNGESLLNFNYNSILYQDILVNSVKMTINHENCEIICGINPLLEKSIIVFRVKMQIFEDLSHATDKDESFSIIPSKINAKSVLRRKLKGSPEKDTNWKNVMIKKNIKSTISASNSSFKFPFENMNNNSLSLPTSARTIKIIPKTTYFNESLKFSEKYCSDLSYRLSDGLSYVKLAISKDGKYLAGGGGNQSPIVIVKTKPIFESVQSFNNFGKVTSLNFSFCSKYLLIGASDCKTHLIDWYLNKKLLSFEISSKFNENVHSQFYYMDKFILMAEDNKILIHSYHFRPEGSNLQLIAGSFTIDCQSITSLAAPNQFYSHLIFIGGSNKSLNIFDANAQTVMISKAQAHSKSISCIKINETPKSQNNATLLSEFFITSANSYYDPIKLWDIRTAKCELRISDVNPEIFVTNSRPSISSCGRYIGSGFEENRLTIYDVRKIKYRVNTMKLPSKTAILDTQFDPNYPILWCALRNGRFLAYNAYE